MVTAATYHTRAVARRGRMPSRPSGSDSSTCTDTAIASGAAMAKITRDAPWIPCPLESPITENDALRARLEVLLQLGPRQPARRGLDDDVHAEVAPGRNDAFLLSREERDLAPDDVEMSVLCADLVREAAEESIELQQILDGRRVAQVAHGADQDVVSLVEDPEDVTSDPSEAHDAHGHGHAGVTILFSNLLTGG